MQVYEYEINCDESDYQEPSHVALKWWLVRGFVIAQGVAVIGSTIYFAGGI